MRLVIGVDGQFVYHTFKVPGQKFYFPYCALRDLVEGDGDEVLEMYAPVIRLPQAATRQKTLRGHPRTSIAFGTLLSSRAST